MIKKHIKLSISHLVMASFVFSLNPLATALANTWYVDGYVTTSGGGTSWVDALKTIQEAVDTANTEDEIWVRQGTYPLSTTIDVRKVIAIYGGFDGTETQRDQRDWNNNVTTLDGQNSGVRRMSVSSDATID